MLLIVLSIWNRGKYVKKTDGQGHLNSIKTALEVVAITVELVEVVEEVMTEMVTKAEVIHVVIARWLYRWGQIMERTVECVCYMKKVCHKI